MNKIIHQVFSNRIDSLAIILVLISAPFISWSAITGFDKIALFGFFLLPFILRTDSGQKGSLRYVILAAVFALFYIMLGQSYWGLACGISLVFALIELKWGKLNEMALYALLFYLPITRSFFTLFGFYIRLEITKWAAHLISILHPSVYFQGTQLYHSGEQYSVDAGCMGLRLVITGFLLTLLILNQTAISYKIKLKPVLISSFLSLSFLLVLGANFVRIVFLILFKSAEGTVSHEVIGIASLLVFHIFPMILLIRYFLRKKWVVQQPIKPTTKRFYKPALYSLSLVSMLMIWQTFRAENTNNNPLKVYDFPGYTASKSPDGVVTYARGKVLFTLKPMNPLSFSNHHPMICWRGDGFEISNESSTALGETKCMQATLKSANNNMQTVWWYANSSGFATTNELQWRLRSVLDQEKFYLLNFTSSSRDEMIYSINEITNQIEN